VGGAAVTWRGPRDPDRPSFDEKAALVKKRKLAAQSHGFRRKNDNAEGGVPNGREGHWRGMSRNPVC